MLGEGLSVESGGRVVRHQIRRKIDLKMTCRTSLSTRNRRDTPHERQTPQGAESRRTFG